VRFFGNTQSYFRNQQVLYNVVPANPTPSVRVEVGINGNLLAPSSVYNQPGLGVFIGQVIVADVQQVLQINLVPCSPPHPSNNHNNSNSHYCPAWETDCAGLDLTLDESVYSFRDMNAIAFGDFTANTGDIEGRLAVQGDAQFGYGYSVGYALQTASGTVDRHLPYSLIVGGDLFWGSGALYPSGNGIPYPGLEEDMFVGGEFTTNLTELTLRVKGSCGETSGCLDSTFNAAQTCYKGYSDNIAAVADNVVKSIEWSALMISCNDASASAYYVSLTSAEYGQFTYTTISNCNFQANWFINIRGTDDVTISGDSFPGVPGGVVYNIEGCGRTITISETTLSGHFLGPCSDLNQPTGLITGKVVARNVIASLQINRENTCPQNITITIPVVVQVPSIVSTQLDLAGENVAVVGDELDATHTVIATYPGSVVSLNNAISANAGDKFNIKVQSVESRTPDNSELPATGSASAVSMAVAVIVALIALAF